MKKRIYIYQECIFGCSLVLLYKLRYQSRQCTSCIGNLDGDTCIRVLHQHLCVLLKPLASPWCTFHAALTVALTAGLDPDNAVDERVLDSDTGLNAVPGGSHVAPFTPGIVSILQLSTTTSKTMQKKLKLPG